jgi:hypothetical protein
MPCELIFTGCERNKIKTGNILDLVFIWRIN